MPVAGDGDVLVAIAGDKVCRYNVQNGSGEEVVDMEHRLQYGRPDGSKYMCLSYYTRYVVPYMESLVSPRLEQNQSIDIPDLTIFLEHSYIGLVCF